MKTNWKNRSLIVLAVASLGFGGAAYAAGMGNGPCMGGEGGMGGMQGQRGNAAGMDRSAYMEKRLDALHTALKLEAGQEAAWQTWSNAAKASMQAMKPSPEDRQAMMQLPAPERLAKMAEKMKEGAQRMDAGVENMRTFYEQLSTTQKATFDQMMPMGGHRGAKGMGPGMGPQRRG